MIKILNDNTKRIETFNLNKHELPFVISIPHSGVYISDRMNNKLLDNVIFSSMDWYLPKLYSFLNELGFTTIINNVSRYEIDVNRDMKNKGVGESFLKNYIYTNTTFGDKMYQEELSLEDINYRIKEFYIPYYQAIYSAIQEKLKYFDKVYLIDLHSFAKFLDADAILGNDNGNTTSNDFIQLVEELLNNEGYKIKKNKPYCGGYITKHYGNDIENCEALQIELWYGSYIGNIGVKNEQFPYIDEEIFKEAQEKMKRFFINLKNSLN